MSRNKLYRILFFVLALLVLIAVPTRPAGIADGLPADCPLELWIVFLLAGGFFILRWDTEPRRATRLALALAAVAVLKLAVASASLPHGLVARYYSNPEFKGPPEASIEWRLPGATRLDRSIDFAPEGFYWLTKPFPLWFFNDTTRFNYYRPEEPNRRRLPFSVRWDGFVRSPGSEPITFRFVTNDQATLFIMGEAVASTPDGNPQATLSLDPGWHPIALTYVYMGGGARSLGLEWGREGAFRPVPSSALLPMRPSPTAERWDRRMVWPSRAVFVLQFLVVGLVLASGLGGVPRRKLLTEGVAVYVLVGVLMAFGTVSLGKRGRAPDWNFLNGGDDPLHYETMARQIIMERDLLNQVKIDMPFYYTVGYRYVLAAAHSIMGPSKAMVVFFQYCILAIACAPLYYIVRRFGPPWLALFATFYFFSGSPRAPIYRWPTDFFPAVTALLVVALVLVLTAACRERPSAKRGAETGLLFGLACILRPNILLFGPIALVWIVSDRSHPVEKRLTTACAWLLAASLAIAPVTWRNWHVSGEFVLLNKGGSINLWEGNTPPDGMDLSRVGKYPLYQRLGFDTKTQLVLEYLRQMPASFLKGLGKKALHVLGFVPSFSLSLVALHFSYFLGAYLHWRGGKNRAFALLLHCFVLTQWAVLIMLKPWPHEPKNQLPTFLAIFPFAAIFLASAAERAFSGTSGPSLTGLPLWSVSPSRRLLAALALGAFLLPVVYLPRLPFVLALLIAPFLETRIARPGELRALKHLFH